MKENSMVYRKTTSRLRNATKRNTTFLLIGFCTFAVLLAVVTPSLDPAHAQQAEGYQSPLGPHFTVTSATPEPYFSVTWTADAVSFSDVTNGPVRKVRRRHIVKSGNAIVRKLDD